MNEPIIHRIVMMALVAFIIAAAIPFVPGAEIGFALLLIFGGKAAPLVYAGMVLALSLTYCTAALVPVQYLVRVLSWLGLDKTSGFIAKLGKAKADERETILARTIPSSFGSKLVRNRYLVLAIALNTPGNSLVGGGGGLAFLAGKSGVFGFWPFVTTVSLAVAPVPFAFWISYAG